MPCIQTFPVGGSDGPGTDLAAEEAECFGDGEVSERGLLEEEVEVYDARLEGGKAQKGEEEGYVANKKGCEGD